MGPRHMSRVIAVATLFGLAGSPFAVSAYAQASCTQEMNRQNAALDKFGSQVSRDANGLAADEAARAAVGDELVDGVKEPFERAQAILEGDPTAGAYEEFKQRWQEYQDSVAGLRHFSESLDRLIGCMNSIPPGINCLKKFEDEFEAEKVLLDKSAEAGQKWIESLKNDNITRAAERVERARGVVQKVVGNAQNLLTAAISGGMQNCMRDFKQRVQQAQNSNPVSIPKPKPNAPLPQPQPRSGAKSGGGPRTSTIVAGAVVAGAVGVGLAAKAASASQTANCSSQESALANAMPSLQNAVNNLSACGGSSSCINSRMGAFQSTWSTAANAAGNLCTCAGANVNSYISASEKAAVQQMWSLAPSLGLNPGALPSCFR